MEYTTLYNISGEHHQCLNDTCVFNKCLSTPVPCGYWCPSYPALPSDMLVGKVVKKKFAISLKFISFMACRNMSKRPSLGDSASVTSDDIACSVETAAGCSVFTSTKPSTLGNDQKPVSQQFLLFNLPTSSFI